MLRTSRRGLADLIVMIVMIVFLLGMVALALFASDKASKEKQYLARLRQLAARQSSELDATRAKYAEASGYVGFKGDGDFSSPEAIRLMLKRGSEAVAGYYEVVAANADQKGQIKGTGSETRKFGPGKEARVGTVGGTTLNDKRVYEAQDSMTLESAIGAQDHAIQEMVGTHNKKVLEQRVLQRKFRDEAATARKAQGDTDYAALEAAIETARKSMEGRALDLANKEAELAKKMKEEVEAYSGLDSTAMREQRETAFAKLREAALARHKSADAQDQYRRKSDARRLDDSRDPDGFVFLVDKKSGWLWINIGQRQGVAVNQTFQVLRADAARAGYITIGEIRVKEVMEGNIARCRVDQLDEADLYPAQGDMIRNANFSSRQYQTFALVGKFGGQFSQHTRQELKDMLLDLGFRVVSKIDGATDAVITGGDWLTDPVFAEAAALQLNFERYTEAELLYFLGFNGPDPKDK